MNQRKHLTGQHRVVAVFRARAAGALACLALASLSACGSGGETTRRVSVRTLELTSLRGLDGWVRSDGELAARGEDPGIGDLNDNLEVRLFFSFDLSEVPPTADIEEAQLTFKPVIFLGTPRLLGPLLVERIDMGVDLDPVDFSVLPLSTPTTAQVPQTIFPRTLGITSLVLQAIREGRTRLDLRLRMQTGTDFNGRTDFLGIETSDNDYRTGERPRLNFRYRDETR